MVVGVILPIIVIVLVDSNIINMSGSGGGSNSINMSGSGGTTTSIILIVLSPPLVVVE